MICPNCGIELSNGVSFCRECGYKLPKEPQKLFCRECGNELEPNSKFCSSCGVKILREEDFLGIEEFDDTQESAEEDPITEIAEFGNNSRSGVLKRFWDGLDGFSKTCTCVVLFFLVALMISWAAHKPFALIVTIIQIVLVGITWGIHLRIIETDKRWLSWILPVIILLLAFAYVEDFKPQNNIIPENNITVETTEYVLPDDVRVN